MKLPKLPYRGRKTKRQIISFRGLNRSENTQEGELRASDGLSTAAYPCLTQRKGRTRLEGYTDPTDIFEWDGKLMVVDGGVLYCDGEAVTNVTDGKKQWAVVNSKLCVWPDKISVDLKNNEFVHLEASVTTGKGVLEASVTVTDSTLTAALSTATKRNLKNGSYAGSVNVWCPALYTYGYDVEKVKACWNEAEKTWKGLEALETLTGIWDGVSGRTYCDNALTESKGKIERIFIPAKNGDSFSYITADAQRGERPDRSRYNTEGYYAVFTKLTSKNGSDGYTLGIDGSTDVCPWFDVYQVGRDTPLFSGAFDVGDAVSVTGTPYGACDVENRVITDIDNKTNTLTFAPRTFLAPYAYYAATNGIDMKTQSQYYLTADGNYYNMTFEENVKAGHVLLVITGEERAVLVWDPKEKKVVKRYSEGDGLTVSSSKQGTELKDYLYTIKKEITIKRCMPELDYICESGNRLWGVSNKDRTIYASALGLPERFYEYGGTSNDAYALAVGSEGDFTAVCAFGGGVCCWKENRLHKVLGSFPAEYYTAEYEIAGVQATSERSMAIINETLYYKGVDGVYAFGGGTPSPISYRLGRERLKGGVGARDGDRYCLSVIGEDGTPQLLVYDTVHGLWLQEDSIRAEAMATANGTLHLLDSGGGVWRTEEQAEPFLTWTAELVPFDETGHERKGYSRLMLRLDMGEGAWLKVETQEDRGPWRLAWTQEATRAMTLNVPLHPMRCDRFGVRLRGKGRTVIRSLVREYAAGSEV